MACSSLIACRAGMYTEKGYRVSQVESDLVVLPRELLLPEDAERSRAGRTMRLDRGYPIPELAVEILSPTTRTKDVRGKMQRAYWHHYLAASTHQ